MGIEVIIYKNREMSHKDLLEGIVISTLVDTLTKKEINNIIESFNQNNFFLLDDTLNNEKSEMVCGYPNKYTLTYNSDSIKKTVVINGQPQEQVAIITSKLDTLIGKYIVKKKKDQIMVLKGMVKMGNKPKLLTVVRVPQTVCDTTQPSILIPACLYFSSWRDEQEMDDTISITIKLKIDENGQVIDTPRVIQTTGHPEWDKEIVECVKSNGPWSKGAEAIRTADINIRFFKIPNKKD